MSFSPFAGADVISLNSGGTENIIINPVEQIEGFFFCSPRSCADLGYDCGSWSSGCGNTIYCGTCASGSTCTSGVCTVVPSDGDGAAAAGAVAGAAAPVATVSVIPTSINLDMAINTNVEQTILVTSTTSTSQTANVSQQSLDNMVILGATSLALEPGQTKPLSVIFVAPGTPGIYTGSIIIDGKTIPVALNVKTKLLLFDSNIVVLNKDYQVPQGNKLKTEVTLVPLGDKERLDVTLNYVIKDYNGKIYLTKSETLLIEERVNFNRDFDTGMLPLGKYVIGLELIYPNGVAPSSAHFEVVEKPPVNVFGILVMILIILILLIGIIILIVLIIRRLKKKKAESASSPLTLT